MLFWLFSLCILKLINITSKKIEAKYPDVLNLLPKLKFWPPYGLRGQL